MDETIGQEFMRRTQPFYVNQTDQMAGKTQPPLEVEVQENAALIPLPAAENIHFPVMNVRTAIDNRVSIRRYAEENLTLEELAYLLWCTQGVKQITSRPVTMRTVPSAGARHAFETYLLIKQVDDLEPGLYRYIATQHALTVVDTSNTIHEKISSACFSQKMIDNSAVTFIWVAVLERMIWRYGERGYRYLHLDAGHVCQNLYLAAEAINVGVCAIAAFEDNDLNAGMHLDGKQKFAIYLASTGKKIDRK